jgi:hypothetical protein
MKDMQSALQEAFELVDRRENAAALKIVNDLLAGLTPPDRIGAVPPAKATVYNWLQLAKKSLQGEAGVLVTPKIALRSAMALVH